MKTTTIGNSGTIKAEKVGAAEVLATQIKIDRSIYVGNIKITPSTGHTIPPRLIIKPKSIAGATTNKTRALTGILTIDICPIA